MSWEPEKKNPKLCPSCRTRKATKIDECIPWQGDFARDFITPIFEGRPVLEGIRSCGHSDCVNPEHIKDRK